MTVAEYFVRQHDGYPHACDGRNCACASGATAVAFGSGGKQRPSSDDFRERSGRSCIPGVHSPSGGLFISDVEDTAARYGVTIAYGRSATGLLRRTSTQIKTWIKAGHGAVLPGDYDQLPAELDEVPSFHGDHSVWIHDYRASDDTVCWHDPLGDKPRRVKWSVVVKYNQKPGSPVKGLAGFVRLALPDTGTGDEMERTFAIKPFVATWPKDTPVYETGTSPAAGKLDAPRRLTALIGNRLTSPTRLLVAGATSGECDWVPATGYTDRVDLGALPTVATVRVEFAAGASSAVLSGTVKG